VKVDKKAQVDLDDQWEPLGYTNINVTKPSSIDLHLVLMDREPRLHRQR